MVIPPQRFEYEADAVGPDRQPETAFESAFARLRTRVETAARRHTEWPDQVVAGIRAALELGAAEPDTARALSVELMSSGREGLCRLRRLVEHFAAGVRRGRKLYPDSVSLPEITEATLVYGLIFHVAQRLQVGKEADLPAESADLTRVLLAPYMGPEADAVARRAQAGRKVSPTETEMRAERK